MRESPLNIFRNFIVSQQNHWTIYSLVYIILLLTADIYNIAEPISLVWLCLGLVPFAFYLTRIFSKSAWMFWTIHIGIFVMIMCLPTPHAIYRLVYVGCVIFYGICSIYFRYTNSNLGGSTITIIFSFVMTFIAICYLHNMKQFQRNYLYLFVFNVFLYFIAAYVDKYVGYLSVNKHSIGYIPVESIFRSGLKLIVAFTTVLSVIVLGVASVGQTNGLLSFLAGGVKLILKYLLDLLKKAPKVDVWDVELHQEIIDIPINDLEQGSVIVDVLLFIGLIALAVFVVYKLIGLLPLLFNLFKLPKVHVKEEVVEEDIRERYDNVEKLGKKRRTSFLEALSPAERIRKRYKKKVLTSQDRIASEGKRSDMELYTARECSEILKVPQMGDLYEKARYSPYECTVEDVKNMKNACNN